MRKVLKSHSEVAHFWANKVQSEGSASRMFFQGDSIYSYGRHFEIARHVKVGRKTAVLLNTTHYSPSTAKHQCYVRRAIPDNVLVITCSDPSAVNYGHRDNIEAWIRELREAVEKLSRARKPEIYLLDIEHIQARAKIYIDFFKVKLSKEQRLGLYPRNIPKETAKIAAYQKEQAEKAKKQAIKAREAFYSGESSGFFNHRSPDEALLRVDANTLRTSKGVTMPVPVAIRFYNKLMDAWKNNTTVVGEQILNFRIAEFTPNYFRAGCHKVTRQEVERIGPALGCK